MGLLKVIDRLLFFSITGNMAMKHLSLKTHFFMIFGLGRGVGEFHSMFRCMNLLKFDDIFFFRLIQTQSILLLISWLGLGINFFDTFLETFFKRNIILYVQSSLSKILLVYRKVL